MIQIDIEMPKFCWWMDGNDYHKCPMVDDKNGCCLHSNVSYATWEEQHKHCPLHEVTDTDTVSRQDARMCLTGDVTDMSIEQYIEMVDKRLQQLQPSPSRQQEPHTASLETPCDDCYFFTHKCTYEGKCEYRAIWEAEHEGARYDK